MEVDNNKSTKGVIPKSLDGYKSKIFEEDKSINQRFTKTKNQADVETADVFETMRSHTTNNQSKLLSNGPEINHVVSKTHNNTHNSHRTKIARGRMIIPVEITLECIYIIIRTKVR